MDPADVARMTGTDRNLAGVFQPDAATIQLARLGLRRVALRLGVKLYEQSPMLRFELAMTRWFIVRADQAASWYSP